MVNGPSAWEAYYFLKKILLLIVMSIFVQFLEVENRCIMVPLSYLLVDKRTGAQISAGSFWKRAKVS